MRDVSRPSSIGTSPSATRSPRVSATRTPSRPNGVRGWADRVAEVLATAHRRLRLRQPRDPRPDPAADHRRADRAGDRARPDLITIYGGGNDLIRPRCDVDALGELYDDAIGSWPRPARPSGSSPRSTRAVAGRSHGSAAVRDLQRARARDRRTTRCRRPRLLADASRAPGAHVVRGSPPSRAARAPGRGHRGARHPRRPARAGPVRSRPAPSARPPSVRQARRPRVGGRTRFRGSNAASPGGRRATGSRAKRPTLEPI